MNIVETEQVLALQRYLDKHDELLRASLAEYQHYCGDGIDDLPFQRALVDKALASGRQWTAEIATGIGKTIISARVALERAVDGPVVYVCPNRTAVGDTSAGIINKFVRTFSTFGDGRSFALGRVNELSRANDVSFVTPYALAHMLANDTRRTREMLKRASCMVIDEAHHFPEDEDDDLKVYGTIYDAADTLVRDGLTVAMTGTWERLDGMRVMGRERPDDVVTVQDAVNLGRCPEVYGVQVLTEVTATKAVARGDLYDLHLRPRERARYLEGVADCMLATRRRYPVPFAGFVRTIADAQAIANSYNSKLRRGERPLALLVSSTSVVDRLATVRAIEEGRLAGYVTCAVGEEALDLPKLEVVHLVRRTRSLARNMQAVGRALRVCPGKRRALVIDYQTMLEGVTQRFIGLGLDDLARRQGTEQSHVVNGGPMVAQRTYQGATLAGMTVGEERALVLRATPTDETKQELLALATSGARRPRSANRRNNTTVPRHEALLARKLYNYTVEGRGTCYDAAFHAKLRETRPDWFDRNDADDKKALLLRMAAEGKPKPTRSSKDVEEKRMAMALYNYCYEASNVYDAAFVARLEALRPEWLRRVRNWDDANKEQLRQLAKSGAPKPGWNTTMGRALRRVVKPTSRRYSPEFAAEIQKLRPDWLESSSALKKSVLMKRAKRGGTKPQFTSKDPNERSLAGMLWKYTNPSKSYDADFVEKLREIRPQWLPEDN